LANITFDANPVTVDSLVAILDNLLGGRITGSSAKSILSMIFNGDLRGAQQIIEEDDLAVQQLDEDVYTKAALRLIEQNPEKAQKVRNGEKGKFQWFVGQMIRESQGKIDAKKAASALKPLLSQ
jgi:aspartyl-tRNA(Asn)/glutamyl-tRNA(Gln) amidotransferase subunit B